MEESLGKKVETFANEQLVHTMGERNLFTLAK